jgi:hypothetical protein
MFLKIFALFICSFFLVNCKLDNSPLAEQVEMDSESETEAFLRTEKGDFWIFHTGGVAASCWYGCKIPRDAISKGYANKACGQTVAAINKYPINAADTIKKMKTFGFSAITDKGFQFEYELKDTSILFYRGVTSDRQVDHADFLELRRSISFGKKVPNSKTCATLKK